MSRATSAARGSSVTAPPRRSDPNHPPPPSKAPSPSGLPWARVDIRRSFDERAVLAVGPEPQADSAGRSAAIMSSAFTGLWPAFPGAVIRFKRLERARPALDRADEVW